jgi:DNA polymerase III epsilon subunit-like protein
MKIDFTIKGHDAMLNSLGVTNIEPKAFGLDLNDKRVGRKILFFDTEVSGLDPDVDEVIEIAMLMVSMDAKQNNLPLIVDSYHGWHAPRNPLEPSLLEILGANYGEKLEGAAFDDLKIEKMFQESDVLVTHNMSFERPYIEKRWGQSVVNKAWLCTLSDSDGDWQGATHRCLTLSTSARNLELPVCSESGCAGAAVMTMGVFLRQQQFFEVS